MSAKNEHLSLFLFLLFITSALSPFLLNQTATAQGGGNAPEKVPISLFFDDGAVGDMVTTSVSKDPVEQINILGSPPPLPAYYVGRWATAQLKYPASIYGAFSCTLWAESQSGAKNAYFVVTVTKGSTAVATFNTTKQTLGSKPVRYDINDDLTVELATGDTLSVTVAFYSDLVVRVGSPIPTPSQAIFLYGGGQYASHITVTTVPMSIEIPEPNVDNSSDYIVFSAQVKEVFDSDPAKMNFTMTITPPSGGEVKTLGEPETWKTDEGVLFTVNWNYRKDTAKSGEYTITFEARYDSNNTFMNTTTYKLKIPKKAVTDLSQTPMRPIILGSAGFGGLLAAFFIFYNRRMIFKKHYEKKAPLKKDSKAGAGNMASKPKPSEKAKPKDDED